MKKDSGQENTSQDVNATRSMCDHKSGLNTPFANEKTSYIDNFRTAAIKMNFIMSLILNQFDDFRHGGFVFIIIRKRYLILYKLI
jgi:hypothetical protein